VEGGVYFGEKKKCVKSEFINNRKMNNTIEWCCIDPIL
jgi:hypothetical protein